MARRRRAAALGSVVLLILLVSTPAGGTPLGWGDPPGKSAPTNTSLPLIAGTLVEGQTLTTDAGSWSGPSPAFNFQWQRCDAAASCTGVDSAGSSHALAAAEVGFRIRVAVTATNKNGSTTAFSEMTAAVAPMPLPDPTASPPPGTTTGSTTTPTTTTTTTATTTTTPTSLTNPFVGTLGYNLSSLAFQSPAIVAAELARIKPLGWVRADFAWEAVEHVKGAFDWTYTDELVRVAATNGLNVLPIIDYSALWASSAPASASGRQFYPPANNADYANYAVQIVNRYGANGSFWKQNPALPYRPITVVELWNEPYQWGFWRTGSDPSSSRYAQLVRAAAPAIHAASPGTTVLMSGQMWRHTTGGDVSGWLQDILATDPTINKLVDGYAVHPYANGGPNCDTCPGHQFIQAKATHDYDPSLPIWITEVGWTSASSCTTYGANATTEANQATYSHDAAVRARTTWGAFVKAVIFHSFESSNGDVRNCEDGYGLRHEWDDSLKPAGLALAKLVSTGS